MLSMIPTGNKLADAIQAAVDHIQRLAVSSGHAEAALMVHVKHTANMPTLEAAFGDLHRQLMRHGKVERSGVTWHLMTVRRSSELRQGPVAALYLPFRYVSKLSRDSRITDLLYLPWDAAEEASFYHAHKPRIVSAPPHWSPPTEPRLPIPRPAPVERSIRDSLSMEERVLPVEHSIDPGFVNQRRLHSMVGPQGRRAIDEAIRGLPELPSWQREVRIGHIHSDVMLALCRASQVPPLGARIADGSLGLICSTGVWTTYGSRSDSKRADVSRVAV